MPAAPPLISVVIPVYDVAGYLDGCLDAILRQGDGGLEVIAVDDASPDESGAILDARAARDQRLHVLHMARNTGPGGARNAGLSRAAGEYVWFVDADDLVADGALAAIAERVTAVRPDLLLVDYESLYPDGTSEPSPGRAEFRRSGGRVLTLADRPGLIHLTMTSWSKVIRRAFLPASMRTCCCPRPCCWRPGGSRCWTGCAIATGGSGPGRSWPPPGIATWPSSGPTSRCSRLWRTG